jgi:GTP pyrophosphokinase
LYGLIIVIFVGLIGLIVKMNNDTITLLASRDTFSKDLEKSKAEIEEKNRLVMQAEEALKKTQDELNVKADQYKKDIEKIHDILAMRLTVEKTEDCYKALGIIHSVWKPLPGKIKDFIAFPKENGYQSLHTTVFTGDGSLVEVQIRTEAMHKEAEYGVAAHALYKIEGEKQKNKKDVALWIKNISSEEPSEIKQEFLSERIFVFTPKGDVVDLPLGASAIDFAYAIHSDIGNKMSGVKINGKLSPIGSILQGGEIVEIITNKNAHPSHKWLEYAKTSFAKKQIKTFS